MILHKGFHGTISGFTAYAVDSAPADMVITEIIEFYTPDFGKIFSNGSITKDSIIVGKDDISSFKEIYDGNFLINGGK